MRHINEIAKRQARPETIIQFGEGGFLRGFFDWMLQKLNNSGKYTGSAVVVQPIEQGMCERLMEQNCLYTHISRGAEGVETTVVDVISRCVNPYFDYQSYLALADNKDIKFVVSNTTESGITYKKESRPKEKTPSSFPAKVTALLYKRYTNKLPGFVFLPCELIDKNAEKLKEIVLEYSEDWNLGNDFINWVNNENTFCNTLVDRIVTGYPKGETIELDYIDEMVNTSEYFHLWVIEGNKELAELLPLEKIGLNVIWTENLEAYRTRKVRILNGAHTAMVPYALLKGFETVKSCTDNEEMFAFIKKGIFDEIIPTLDLPEKELTEYANDVLKRFSNPYINHYLSSISLNSVSKFKVRVLPSILEYKKRKGTYPENLLKSFGALIKFYKVGKPSDDERIIEFMKNSTVCEILSNTDFWGEDLTYLLKVVGKYVD